MTSAGDYPVRIEPATPEDSRAIAEVHVLSWQHAYQGILPDVYLAKLSVEQREATWRESLAKPQPKVLVARSNAGVVGFVAFGGSRDPDLPADCAEVWAIYLAPSAWSQGTGHRLWLAAWERLHSQGFQSASLWVIEGNRRAIAFYEAAGFKAEPDSLKRFEIAGTPLTELRYRFDAAPLPNEIVRRQFDA